MGDVLGLKYITGVERIVLYMWDVIKLGYLDTCKMGYPW